MGIRLIVLLAAGAAFAVADQPFGPVDPQTIPDLPVTTHEGAATTLHKVVRARRVAWQFVFMDCRTTCPLLGSLFKNVDRDLEAGADAQMISVTVNPKGDSPAKLRSWLVSHKASPRWMALRLTPKNLKTLLAAFGQEYSGTATHSLMVFLSENRNGKPAFAAIAPSLPRSSVLVNALAGRPEMAGAAPMPADSAAPIEPSSQYSATTRYDGEHLYYGTQTLAARLDTDALTARASRCANCHGADRQGGSEGVTRVPGLTKSDLLSLKSRRGGPPSVYTEESFCSALRAGVDPAGIVFSPTMPRYTVPPAACSALWNYLSRKGE